MNQKSFHFFRSTSVLEEEINSAPVLSEFVESIQLIGGNIFSLFVNRSFNNIKNRTLKIETTCDIYKKKIIAYCKNIDSSRIFNVMASISDENMQKIGPEFFYITARRFAKNQSIENFSKFLFLIFKNFEFDCHFLKGFFSSNRDFNEVITLLKYMEQWNQEELKTESQELVKGTLIYGLEKFSLYSQFDDFFGLFENKSELLKGEDQSTLRKLLLSMLQTIMYKNYPKDLFIKSIHFFEDKGLEFDSFTCNKLLDIVNKYLKEDGYLDFIVEFMEEKNLKMNIVSYNIIMDYYCMTNQFKRANQIYEGLEQKGIKADSFTYSILIKGIKNMARPDFKIASKFFELYKNENEVKDIIIFNSILDVFISFGNIQKADEIFSMIKQNPDLVPDQITFNTLIKGCCKAKDFDNSLKYFHLMKKNNLKPNRITYNSLMDLAVKIQKLPEALNLVVEMQKDHISPDGFTYSIILNGLKINNSNINLVKLSLNNIEKVLKTNEFKQDEILFNSILDVCSKYELYDEMEKFYGIMKDKKIKESNVTYVVLIKAFGKLHNFDRAYEMFEKMIQSNMKINDITYGSILDACAKSGNMNIAMKIYKSLQKNKINLNSIVFTTILKGFIKVKAFEQAISFFKEVKHHTDLPGMIITYNCALDIYAIEQKVDLALELFDEINKVFKADLISYSTIIKALCHTGKRALALEYVKKMIQAKIKIDVSVVNLFLENCSNKIDFKLAIKGYQYAMMQNICPNEITFGIMIKVFGFSRELYKAFDLLDLMDVYNIKPSIIIYTNLVHISFYNRKVRKAELAYTLLRKQKIKGDCLLYSKLIDGLIRFRDINKVPKYVNYALKEKCTLKRDTITSILKHLDTPDMRKKLDVIKHFKKNEFKGNKYNNKIQNKYHIENPKRFKKIMQEKQRKADLKDEQEKPPQRNFTGRSFRRRFNDKKETTHYRGNNWNSNKFNNNNDEKTNSWNNNGEKGTFKKNYGEKKPLKLFNFRQKKTA